MLYYSSEDNMNYDDAGFINEQVKFERYYNIPVDTGDQIFASMHYYMEYLEKKRVLDSLTIGLKALIADMVQNQQTANMVSSLEEFPPLN
jgi:hypothetical protein